MAIKKIFDPVITKELLDDTKNEIDMLSRLRHPNIVCLMAKCVKPPDLIIVQEYLSMGCLFDILHKSSMEMSLKLRVAILKDVATALAFMHFTGVCHRDIKSHNVLLDKSFSIAKICDFGLCKTFSTMNSSAMKFAGTAA